MARAAAVIGRLGKDQITGAHLTRRHRHPLIHLRIGVGPQLHAGLTPRPPREPRAVKGRRPLAPHIRAAQLRQRRLDSLPTLPGGISRPVSIRGDGRRPPDPPPLEPPPNPPPPNGIPRIPTALWHRQARAAAEW